MSLEILKDELKQNVFRPVYYLYGQESYLKYFYYSSLKSKALGDGDASFDFVEFSGQSVSAEELTEAVQGFPVVCAHKVVTVVDPVFSSEAVKTIIENPDFLSESSVLIFLDEIVRSEAKTDKKFSAFIAKYGLEIKVEKPDRRTLEAWVAKRLRTAGKTIDRDALEYLFDNVGEDMSSLNGELGKLTAYCENEITVRDIDTVCTKTYEARTFDLSDAVLSRDGARAYRVLNILMDMQAEPNLIAGAVFGAVGNLFKVKMLAEQNVSPYEMAERLGMKDFIVRKTSAAANKLTMKRICEMVDLCTAADEEMKLNVGAADPYLPLIKLTAVLCS